MSSNISITRICQYCGDEFEAKTTVTKYCNHTCNRKAWKLKAKQEKIQASNKETQQVKDMPLTEIRAKEYLTVKEVALLLNCSPRTVYDMITVGRLNAINLSKRNIRVHKRDVDNIFESNILGVVPKIQKKSKKDSLKVEDCYSIGEIEEKYGIYSRTLFELFKRKNVEKLQKGKFVYVSKEVVHELLNNFKVNVESWEKSH